MFDINGKQMMVTIHFGKEDQWIYERLKACSKASGFTKSELVKRAVKEAVKDAPLFFNQKITK